MNCRERSGVASVEGIEQRARLDSTHFAENDPVGSEAESVSFNKSSKDTLVLKVLGLAFGCNYVRLPDLKLGGVFDDEDAFIRPELSWRVSAEASSFRSPFRR